MAPTPTRSPDRRLRNACRFRCRRWTPERCPSGRGVRLDSPTRLEQAASNGDVAVLRRMLCSGHNVDAIDGPRPHRAHAGFTRRTRGRGDVAIARGAGLDHRSKFGLSALMLAVICGHSRIARALVTCRGRHDDSGNRRPRLLGKSAADLAEEQGNKRLAMFIRVPHSWPTLGLLHLPKRTDPDHDGRVRRGGLFENRTERGRW